MEVIAEKKKGLVGLYLFGFALGVFIFIAAILSEEPLLLIPGIFVLVLTAIILIRVLITPNQIILLDKENNKIYLPKNKYNEINLKDVEFVAYKKARAKHHEYKWGDVIIHVNHKKVKCSFVKDCEQVAKYIYTLVEKTNKEDLYGEF